MKYHKGSLAEFLTSEGIPAEMAAPINERAEAAANADGFCWWSNLDSIVDNANLAVAYREAHKGNPGKYDWPEPPPEAD